MYGTYDYDEEIDEHLLPDGIQFSVTYSTFTHEDIENGGDGESGWENESLTYDTLEDLVWDLDHKGYSEWSSYPLSIRRESWLSTESTFDYYDGSYTYYSIHPETYESYLVLLDAAKLADIRTDVRDF